MKDFINSSALTKMLANVFIFVVLMASVGIAIYDAMNNQAINPYVTSLLGGGLTYAVGILGMHVGGVQALQAQQSNADAASTLAAALPALDPEATQQRPAVVVPAQSRVSNAIQP